MAPTPAPKYWYQTADFGVDVQEIRSSVTVNGLDTVYGVVNKKTGVTEFRLSVFLNAVVAADELQKNSDEKLGNNVNPERRDN